MTTTSVSAAIPRRWPRRVLLRIRAALIHLLGPSRGRKPRLLARRTVVTLAIAFGFIFAFVMVFLDVPANEAARALPVVVRELFAHISDWGMAGTWLYPIGLSMVLLSLAPSNLTPAVQAMIAALMVRAGFIFTAIAVPSVVTTIAKRVIGRARPFVGGNADVFLYRPLEWNPAAYSSLPSGHATTAVAAAIAVGALWPRVRPIMWIYALLVCVSRVVTGAHHPSDVVAGGLVGAAGVLLVRHYFASRRLGFGVGENGAVVPFEGPSRKRVKSVARALLTE